MSSVNENLQASSDEAIVKRVQEGDVNAYNILVIKYQHRVAQIISKFLNSSDDVSDVAQEAFIKAYKAINSFRGESSFYTWLYRIVVNAANHTLSRIQSINTVLMLILKNFSRLMNRVF